MLGSCNGANSADGSGVLVDQPLCVLQAGLYVAHVSSGQYDRSCHNYNFLIILLTLNAKWVNTMVGFPFCRIWAIADSASATSDSMFWFPMNGAKLRQNFASSPHRQEISPSPACSR